MVNTRASDNPTYANQENAQQQFSVRTTIGNNGSSKVTHELEEHDGSNNTSPHVAKKRRTGSVSEVVPESSNVTEQPLPDKDLNQDAQNATEQSSIICMSPVAKVEPNGSPDGNLEKKSANGSPTAIQAATTSTFAPDQLGPDVAEVISNIMSYSERVEEQYNLSQQLKSSGGGSQPLVFIKANSQLMTKSLPILDNLSSQILTLLAQSSYQDLTSIVSEPNSECGQAYSTMRSLFNHTKNVYSSKGSFLSPRELNLTEPSQMDIIRKANMASFVSSIFGSQEIGFSELDQHFLEIFVPEGSRLLKVQGALFLELKTQAYIAAMNSGKRSRTEILYELFPDDLEERLLSRRPGTKQLAPSETDFVKRVFSRRDILLNEVNNPEAASALPQKYRWEDFLRDLSSYVSKNFEAISHQQTKKPSKGRPSTNGEAQEVRSAPLEGQFSVIANPPEVSQVSRSAAHSDLVARAARAAQIALQGQGRGTRNAAKAAQQGRQIQPPPATQAVAQLPPQQQSQPQPQPQPEQQQPQLQQQPQYPSTQTPQQQQVPHPQHQSPKEVQFVQSPQHAPAPPAYRLPQSPRCPASQHLLHQAAMTTTFPAHPTHPAPAPPAQAAQITFHQAPLNFQQYNPATAHASVTARAHAAAANYGYMPGVPHYSQSQPTQILYERARMATTAKSSPANRRAGLPSQRRPWTTEEENALMAGLDRVKGPHWSQILAMFGPGGTINETLKDRNQVQLKDKARNLKLFFLKSGIEVPYYLKFVTGELKTRAPAQAAKHEARERQRRLGDEDKAHVEGIEGMMALAGAHSGSNMSPESAHSSMVDSPGLMPQQQQQQHPDVQHAQDQSVEQAIIQSLEQEVRQDGMHLEQQPKNMQHTMPQGMVDPSLQPQQ
ncbi:telomeric DNA-binding factor trf1 [Histoplasma capsulatum G186AR]|uniref:Telomeric DNA-binding factor trf1 n=1 Tax=Ajellomyces capsulatus TaxID=5037 RepID=A0A8H7ZBS5_AJECA|nr:telomeric DNA-binding factor trf1 [Histoplasma capsulatum]QSS75817.1 telomeric DNA-binding factor trf1 [Histoplasma capsulatum G186AR]